MRRREKETGIEKSRKKIEREGNVREREIKKGERKKMDRLIKGREREKRRIE